MSEIKKEDHRPSVSEGRFAGKNPSGIGLKIPKIYILCWKSENFNSRKTYNLREGSAKENSGEMVPARKEKKIESKWNLRENCVQSDSGGDEWPSESNQFLNAKREENYPLQHFFCFRAFAVLNMRDCTCGCNDGRNWMFLYVSIELEKENVHQLRTRWNEKGGQQNGFTSCRVSTARYRENSEKWKLGNCNQPLPGNTFKRGVFQPFYRMRVLQSCGKIFNR